MTALKAQLLDNKMEDESISDQMLAITVGQAKQMIKDKAFIKVIYSEVNKGHEVWDNKLTKQEFAAFAKTFVPKMSDFEAFELFNFVLSKNRKEFSDTASFASKDSAGDKLDLSLLDFHFEKWFREEDSLNAFTNARLTTQKFKDFKIKIEVWNKYQKYRTREKKTYKRHTHKIRDVIQHSSKEFTFENELVEQCIV